MVRLLVSTITRFIPRHLLQVMAAAALRSVAFIYKGSRFEDPISGKQYRKLLPYGRIHSRPNALAPHTLSLERHRLVWLYLKEKTDFFSAPHRVLHVAPEYCFVRRFKELKNIEYITADLISPWADVKLDVQDIPLPDSTFDVILCNHVLEHVADDNRALREFYRVMKKGGFGIFQVPIDGSLDKTAEDSQLNTPELRELHYGQRDHVRLYGLDYPVRLRAAGFDVFEDRFVKHLPEELVTRYALPKDEIIYLCTKV